MYLSRYTSTFFFFQAGSPPKRAAVVAMRCGVPEKEPHITGHINFAFLLKPHSLSSPLADAPSSKDKKKGSVHLGRPQQLRKSLRQLL